MKKLNLEKIRTNEKSILNRNQMKQIIGGYTPGVFTCECNDGSKHELDSCGMYPDGCEPVCISVCIPYGGMKVFN